MKIQIQPVILSGGSGTRLWPYSRESYPKQFLPLASEKTLFQETVLRLEGLGREGSGIETLPPIAVCNETHRFLVAEQLRQLGLQRSLIVLEPMGRNTAPAVTVAAHLATQEGRDPVLVVMPSDHLIKNLAAFRECVAHAARLAQEGYVVTFGIVPVAPETGYGYLRKGAPIDSRAATLDRFVEKPDEESAQRYLEAGAYLWNSGIFVMRAAVWLTEIAQHRPDIAAACRDAYGGGAPEGDFFRVDEDPFAACPSDSVDYAVMEKLAGAAHGAKAAVLPLDAGWSDLGSWPALGDAREQDQNGNVVHGDVFALNARNSLLFAENRFLAALGIEDLIVIETTDAVLVAHKESAQEIRSVTEHLRQAQRSEHIYHSKVHRPWGAIEAIDQGPRYRVNRLSMKPGAALDLQLHYHRAKSWIVVCGTARVRCGEETFLLSEGQSAHIPVGTPHRLENPGTIALEVVEVQSGGYLGDDDVVALREPKAT